MTCVVLGAAPPTRIPTVCGANGEGCPETFVWLRFPLSLAGSQWTLCIVGIQFPINGSVGDTCDNQLFLWKLQNGGQLVVIFILQF